MPAAAPPPTAHAALILDLGSLAGDDLIEAIDLAARLRLRGAVLAGIGAASGDDGPAQATLRSHLLVCLDAPADNAAARPSAKTLLALARTASGAIDLSRSWLATRTDSPAVRSACATAGLTGIVVIGGPAIADDGAAGPVVRTAPRLIDATLSMVPRAGGCWHG